MPAKIAGHNRANAMQPNSVATPTRPTPDDTSLRGNRAEAMECALMTSA